MNQPKEKDEEEQPGIPVPDDEIPPAPVCEPETQVPIEEPEPKEPKKIVKI